MMEFIKLKLSNLTLISTGLFFFITWGVTLGRFTPQVVFADDCLTGSVQDCVDELIHVTNTHINITSSIQAEIIDQQTEFNENMTNTLKVIGLFAGVLIFAQFFNLAQFLFHK